MSVQPYIPEAGDVGFGLIQKALRDYLIGDPELALLLAEVPDLRQVILPEGFMTAETPTPAILITQLPDGNTGAGVDDHLLRLGVIALDRGRGYYRISQVMWRLRVLINSVECFHFLTFPAEIPLMVSHISTTGGTDSTTYPRYKAEASALYVFVRLIGVPIGS